MGDPVDDWLTVTRPRGALVAAPRLPARWGLALDPVDAVAWHVVRSGDAWLHVDGEDRRLTTGDVVLLPKGPRHALRSHREEPPQPLAAARFTGPVATRLLCGTYSGSRCPVTSAWAGLPAVLHVPAAAMATEPNADAVLALIEAEVSAPNHGSEPIVGALLDALMVYVFRAFARVEGRAGGWVAGIDDPILGPALQRLHREPAAAWSVDALARVSGVSRSAFAKHFAEQMGEAPMEYVRRWRMALAARMLLDGADNLAQIAEHVGYQSEFAFQRAFKRVLGTPPGRFRKGPLPPAGPADAQA